MSALDKQSLNTLKGSAKTRRISGTIQPKASIGGTVAIGKFPIDPQTFILVAETGIETAAVLSGDEVVFTATANDIRIGMVAATADGITEGTKVIPSYNTSEGVVGIPAGSEFIIRSPKYDYTKLQGLICLFNTSLANSTATEKVAINDNVYDVGSHIPISTVTKDNNSKSILFGLKNDTKTPKVIRYFMYREEN